MLKQNMEKLLTFFSLTSIETLLKSTFHIIFSYENEIRFEYISTIKGVKKNFEEDLVLVFDKDIAQGHHELKVSLEESLINVYYDHKNYAAKITINIVH